MRNVAPLRPGSLWPAITEATRNALQSGSLRPIETQQETVPHEGVDFQIRSVSSLARKSATTKGEAPATNPFLSPEKDLFIGDISDTHFCVLNKFNVIDHHVLLVTRHFEPQESLLKLRDFLALCTCLREFKSLGFYNGGVIAGASQPHKHLQLVPLPLNGTEHVVPMAALFASLTTAGTQIRNIPDIPFAHMFSWLSESTFEDCSKAAEVTYDLYVDMLEALGMRGSRDNGELRQPSPYNLLLTRNWMMLVPRTAECFQNVSVNALGFAGSLFVRDEAALQSVKQRGPMSVLQELTWARKR